MSKRFKAFNAKIMLFGEYSVIRGSMGFSVPFSHFKGELDFHFKNQYTDFDFAVQSNKMLRDYAAHIEKLTDNRKLSCSINHKALQEDLNNGLYFESTIPQGYGLGSSGALVASIYDAYVTDKMSTVGSAGNKEFQVLKNTFSLLESYFHGTSSGIDPLMCYLGSSIVIKGPDEISTSEISTKEITENRALFLINTGKPGKTEPLVKHFMKACEDPEFDRLIKETLIPTNNQCIQALLDSDYNTFDRQLIQLSSFQHDHFRPMIPEQFLALWEDGLEDHKLVLKLCGSGGGGFLLGFSPDYEAARERLIRSNKYFITVYKKA
jgi:mevalonate kinase